MKKIDYALKNTDNLREIIINCLCPSDINLKDREDCEEIYHIENNPCENCWNQEVESNE